MKKVIALIVLLLCPQLITGCFHYQSYPRIGTEQFEHEYDTEYFRTAIGTFEYRVNRGDILQILVWENDDLNTEAIVRPDGKISVPLAGDVLAAGLTLSELDEILTRSLKTYIRYPEISVMVKEIKGNRVVILGEVKKPGVYNIIGDETLLEIVGCGGGFTEDAVLSSVVVIRRGLSGNYGMRANLSGAIASGMFEQNIFVKSGDIIYVPKKFIADINYFVRQIEPVLDLHAQGAGIKALIESEDTE